MDRDITVMAAKLGGTWQAFTPGAQVSGFDAETVRTWHFSVRGAQEGTRKPDGQLFRPRADNGNFLKAQNALAGKQVTSCRDSDAVTPSNPTGTVVPNQAYRDALPPAALIALAEDAGWM